MVWIIFDHSSTTSEWRNVKVVEQLQFPIGNLLKQHWIQKWMSALEGSTCHTPSQCPHDMSSRYLGSECALCHSLWHADLQEKIFCNSKLWICQGTTLLVCKSLLPFQSLFEKPRSWQSVPESLPRSLSKYFKHLTSPPASALLTLSSPHAFQPNISSFHFTTWASAHKLRLWKC